MNIEIAPTGKLVTGSIFDGNRERIQRLLNVYDPQVKIHWNPLSNEGYGGWELHYAASWDVPVVESLSRFDSVISWQRIKPQADTHIKFNIPVLSDKLVDELKKRDMWAFKTNTRSASENLENHIDDQEDERIDRELARRERERKYLVKHEKKAIQAFYEYARSGYNPLWFLSQK